MKIASISDLHGHLPDIEVCDIAIIAGDVTPCWNHDLEYQMEWLETRFANWLANLKASVVIGVWGNHDLAAEQIPEEVKKLRLPWHCLHNQLIEIDGLKIWGTPYQKEFSNGWAFNLPLEDLEYMWARAPKADIYVSHGPVFGFGDKTFTNEHTGSKEFLAKIAEHQPRLVATGHIHEARGVWRVGRSTIANVTHVNLRYEPIHPPYINEIIDGVEVPNL